MLQQQPWLFLHEGADCKLQQGRGIIFLMNISCEAHLKKHRHHADCHDAQHDKSEVVLHHGQVAKEEPGPHKQDGPDEGTNHIVGSKPVGVRACVCCVCASGSQTAAIANFVQAPAWNYI